MNDGTRASACRQGVYRAAARSFAACLASAATCCVLLAQGSGVIRGADLSALPAVEERGGMFREFGVRRDALSLFADHGVNFVRLRLWHTPPDGTCTLERTLQLAERAKAAGSRVLLDIHYSDTWADPGAQTPPAAWVGLTHGELADSVYRYTLDVMRAFRMRGVLPDIVQLGNEITCGMLWNDGRVCDGFDTPTQWAKLADLLQCGIRGVRDSLQGGDTVKIMIHVDRGGDNAGSRWFFDHLFQLGVNADILGLSYYPWWHGSLDNLRENLHDLALRYGKDIVVVETAYPWTLDWCDATGNVVGDSSQLHPGYPATPEGQRRFVRDLLATVQSVPNGKGVGMFYWAPEWITAPTGGSPWENLAMFDCAGNVQPSVCAFDSVRSVAPLRVSPSWNLLSLPLVPAFGSADSLFPSVAGPVFGFDGTGYVPAETLETGSGYWVKVADEDTLLLAGLTMQAETVAVHAGWNLLGGISVPVPVSAARTDPPELLLTSWYAAERAGYAAADTLVPGRGYWVKAAGQGRVMLAFGVNGPAVVHGTSTGAVRR